MLVGCAADQIMGSAFVKDTTSQLFQHPGVSTDASSSLFKSCARLSTSMVSGPLGGGSGTWRFLCSGESSRAVGCGMVRWDGNSDRVTDRSSDSAPTTKICASMFSPIAH